MPAFLGDRFRILFWFRLLPAWWPSAALGFVVGGHSACQPSRWSTTALSLSCSQTLQAQNCLVELIALLDELFDDLTDVHHRRITRLRCISPQATALSFDRGDERGIAAERSFHRLLWKT